MLIILPSATASSLLFNLHNTQSKDTGKDSFAVHASSVPVLDHVYAATIKEWNPCWSLAGTDYSIPAWD